ncbi:MAG TPA: type IV toxin-antitoxin system AbiEi family antitoxin domain-containing protein [Dermatophilaceae bacterium]|nr:type IV toxin-antitoxin system AbiEi family antitoxin domain-containing protein [Dermatophilaceae bacterium]
MIDVPVLLDQLPLVFRLRDGIDAGLSRRVLDRAVRDGLLVRRARGVYANGPAWDAADRTDRHLMTAQAAVLVHPGLPASHHSAALAWQLPTPLALPPWVSLASGSRLATASSAGIARLEPGELPAEHVLHRGGMPVTIPARTLVDCLRTLPLPDAVALVDAAVRQRLVSRAELERMRAFQRGWPNVTKVDQGLMLADPRRENWFESYSFVRLVQFELPLPRAQVEIYDRRGRLVARVDGLWREQGTVGEADGAGKYLGQFDPAGAGGLAAARVVLAEKVREDRIRDLGLELVRWDFPDMVYRPQEVADRVQAAHARGDLGRFRGRLVERPMPGWAA